MTVVDIKRQKNHTVGVLLSNGEAITLDLDYAASLCIRKGDTLTEEKLLEYKDESDYIRAKSRGMWFLNRADHSEKSLYEKIIKGGLPESAAARAIARLKELGMLDDIRYACRLAERMSEAGVSKREAYARLIQKGIPKQLASDVLSDTEFDEGAQLAELINKKYRLKLEADGGIQKVYAALIRKGFSYGAVKAALKKYTQESEWVE